MVAFLKRNWFVCGILAVTGLALAAPPGLGSAIGAGKALATAAVVAVFVLAGLSLPSEAIRHGLANFRVHLLVQTFIFLVAPAWFYLTAGWLAGEMNGRLLTGVYALAVLPTTISSCVVLTQMARGNVTAALFNAVLSNLLGVFISPLLLTLMLRQAGGAMPPAQVLRVLLDLLLTVLAPFLAGQVLRLPLRRFADARRGSLSAASGGLILLIVFLAFCRSSGSGQLRAVAWRLPLPLAYLAASNVLLMALAYGAGRLMRLGRADLAAVLFAAPQKTLALGAPLLSTYFAAQGEVLGIAMLPILFYHPWQLLTAGVARRLVSPPFAFPSALPYDGPPR
jgi:sodium/bile acid cotransporter 7